MMEYKISQTNEGKAGEANRKCDCVGGTRKKIHYFHIMTAGASAITESFLNYYSSKLMESDKMRREAGTASAGMQVGFSSVSDDVKFKFKTQSTKINSSFCT